jgi:hypothetical protein
MSNNNYQNSFDFNAYNKIKENAKYPGMFLWIAQNMAEEALVNFVRFKNPEAVKDATKVIEMLEEMRKNLKVARDQQRGSKNISA